VSSTDGFTFGGTHSGEFGIVFTSTDRQMLPMKRKNEIVIAGRHGAYDQGNTTYDKRQIMVDCAFAVDDIDDIPDRSREIAAWLAKKGELIFDDEPDKAYLAEVVSGLSLSRAYRIGTFTLLFSCEPFAFGVDRQAEAALTETGAELTIHVDGTAETPCRIIITNTGATDITGIRVEHRKED